MTRTDIADDLGLTLETVSPSLGRLKERGLIAVLGRHDIAFKSVAGVRELAQGDEASPGLATVGD